MRCKWILQKARQICRRCRVTHFFSVPPTPVITVVCDPKMTETSHKKLHIGLFHISKMSRIINSMETESQIAVGRDGKRGECQVTVEWAWCFMLGWWKYFGARWRWWLYILSVQMKWRSISLFDVSFPHSFKIVLNIYFSQNNNIVTCCVSTTKHSLENWRRKVFSYLKFIVYIYPPWY